jgi:hypothetical protein
MSLIFFKVKTDESVASRKHHVHRLGGFLAQAVMNREDIFNQVFEFHSYFWPLLN